MSLSWHHMWQLWGTLHQWRTLNKNHLMKARGCGCFLCFLYFPTKNSVTVIHEPLFDYFITEPVANTVLHVFSNSNMHSWLYSCTYCSATTGWMDEGSEVIIQTGSVYLLPYKCCRWSISLNLMKKSTPSALWSSAVGTVTMLNSDGKYWHCIHTIFFFAFLLVPYETYLTSWYTPLF